MTRPAPTTSPPPQEHDRLRATVAMRRSLQTPVPTRTTVPAYQAQVDAGVISPEVDALVDAYVAQAAANSATRSLRRRQLRRYLTWRALKGISCDVGSDSQDQVDAYLSEVPKGDQPKAKMTLREWWDFLASHNFTPPPHIVLPSGRQVGFRRQVAEADGSLADEIAAFEEWLVHGPGQTRINDDRTLRYVVASVSRLALALHDAPEVQAAGDAPKGGVLLRIFACPQVVARYIRDLTRTGAGPEQGAELRTTSKRREWENVVWGYHYLEDVSGMAAEVADARERLRKELLCKGSFGAGLGGRKATTYQSPTTANIDDLRQRMELALIEEADTGIAGLIDTAAQPSKAQIGLMLDRAILEVGISSMMRAESIATMDMSRIEMQREGDYYLAKVRAKRTRGHDDLFVDWVVFSSIMQSYIEPYLHRTDRCLAIGLPDCSARPRLGEPLHLQAGDLWGDTVLKQSRTVYPLWRAPDDPTHPLLYDTLGKRLRRWLHSYRHSDGEPYRVHDIRHYGAYHALVELRLPIPYVQAIGGWKKPDVLLAIYALAQTDDALRAVAREVYPPYRSQAGDPRRRFANALTGFEVAVAELRTLVNAPQGSPGTGEGQIERLAGRFRTALQVLAPPEPREEVVMLPRTYLPLIADMARVCRPELATLALDAVLRIVFPEARLAVAEPTLTPARRERTTRVPLGRGLGALS